MNKKMISVSLIMVLLFSSLFSMTATACCNSNDTCCIPDFLKDFLDDFMGNPCNPCDPCDPDEDDDTDDDDTNDDGDDDDDYVDPYFGSSRGSNNKENTEPPVVETPPNQNPVADASEGEPYEGLINEEIAFDGSSSYDPDGKIVEWFWDFGDGTTETGVTVTHSYPEPDIYFVELKVTDDDGAEDGYGTKIVISHPNRPPTNPTVSSTISAGTPNTRYIFTVVSTDPDGDDIRYIVDWGDGTYDETGYLPDGTIATLNHTWTSAGIYR